MGTSAKRGRWKRKIRQASVIKPFKSNFEYGIAVNLRKRKVKFEYESKRIGYTKSHSYTPDFILPNGIIIEAKGRFTGEDRAKHLLIKEQHPEYDIRFVFQRAQQPLRKGSPKTYADWCDEHGYQWSDKTIPIKWIKE